MSEIVTGVLFHNGKRSRSMPWFGPRKAYNAFEHIHLPTDMYIIPLSCDPKVMWFTMEMRVPYGFQRISREWIRDNTDMYLGTVSVKAKDLLGLLDRLEKMEESIKNAITP